MKIEHVKLDFKMTCPLIDEGLEVIKEKLDSVLDEGKSTVVFNLISAEIEKLRELNSNMRTAAESQLSVMNDKLKNE